MRKDITISVEEDVYEKFCLALNLTKDLEEEAVENCMKWYIAKTFEQVSQEYNPKSTVRTSGKNSSSFYGKAIQRIPLWAKKPEQYNHKIIRAYFICQKDKGTVTLKEMEQLCSDKTVPELYVPTFRSNYAQMKVDGEKTYGKVFEDDGNEVTIWSEVEKTLMMYEMDFSN